MSNYNQLINNFNTLKLEKMAEIMPLIVEEHNNNKLSFIDGLLRLTDAEIAFKDDRAKRINIQTSSFPYIKTIKDFDFSYQPQINKKQIEDLCSLRFLSDKKNIIFLGSPGVGKTHLATAIGIEAASQRISTYFINFSSLMLKMKKAISEKREGEIIKHFLKYTLLIIDEIGYLPVDKETTYLFFQLIAARYENKSTILTTNQPFARWGEVFGDSVVASAILDRLVHHCEIIKINGNSYRIKDKKIFDGEDY
ncbi:MAG: IS21-like element helper ATPase IstB [Alphaproteobacteria bacterium]|nr:IS21-like element helper ATPase IstB [Alphaproteobacteria bacterium]